MTGRTGASTGDGIETSDAMIVDRGYRKADTPRLGRAGARRAIVREGIRRVLGLRRKARQKIFPWALIALTAIAAAVIIGLHWVASGTPVADAVELPTYGEFFDLISRVTLLFIALAAPQLLVPDRSQKVLSIYFSRPLTLGDYLGAKATALAALILGFFLIPEFALHVGLAALSPDGFFAYLGDHLDVLWKIPAVALVYLAGYASVGLAVGAFAGRVGVGAAIYVGLMLLFNGVAAALTEGAGLDAGALLAIEQHPRVVRDWAFGIDTVAYFPERAGFDPWVSLAAVLVVAVGSGVAVWWRYQRIEP